jgi:hypothetical protein
VPRLFSNGSRNRAVVSKFGPELFGRAESIFLKLFRCFAPLHLLAKQQPNPASGVSYALSIRFLLLLVSPLLVFIACCHRLLLCSTVDSRRVGCAGYWRSCVRVIYIIWPAHTRSSMHSCHATCSPSSTVILSGCSLHALWVFERNISAWRPFISVGRRFKPVGRSSARADLDEFSTRELFPHDGQQTRR